MCKDNEPDYLERSFVLSALVMLTVDLKRVKDNGSINNREVSIQSTLKLVHILAGKLLLLKASNSLAALIHSHGDNDKRDGHYSCEIIGERNIATIFNDSHVENLWKDTSCGTTLQFDQVMREEASIVSSEDVTVNTKIVDRQGAAGNDFDATKAMRRIIDHI